MFSVNSLDDRIHQGSARVDQGQRLRTFLDTAVPDIDRPDGGDDVSAGGETVADQAVNEAGEPVGVFGSDGHVREFVHRSSWLAVPDTWCRSHGVGHMVPDTWCRTHGAVNW